MLKKLTQQATDLILHSIASGEVMGANLLITKGNEELVYAQAGMADREAETSDTKGAQEKLAVAVKVEARKRVDSKKSHCSLSDPMVK